MARRRWLEPVYAAQVLTGVAAIGAVLVAERITKWHVLVAVIVAISSVTALIATVHTEAESRRNRANVDTLLRSMELPYFIIQSVSQLIQSIAKSRGWMWTRQENFVHETLYEFESLDGEAGRLVVPEQEFKDLWILDEDARAKAIEARLFGGDALDAAAASARDALSLVVRTTIGQQVTGPVHITESAAPDGALVFDVTSAAGARAQVHFTSERRRKLLAMVPLRRYEMIAEDTAQALGAMP